ncbi:MAG TPA: hypothetical protein VE396_01750 [Xanthobacteraceae bacterium]|jgi:hypothetical protein|nr:hypothetical protein [Xanthobacteraceae bacterium]
MVNSLNDKSYHSDQFFSTQVKSRPGRFAPFIPHHIGARYWLHTALIALIVLLAYDLTELSTQGLNAAGMADLLIERMKDILLGCAMALVGTVAAFPRDPAIAGSDVPPDTPKE